jgi:hypothetical protein
MRRTKRKNTTRTIQTAATKRNSRQVMPEPSEEELGE